MEIGKIYFFTASILDWKPMLKFTETKKIIIDSLEYLVKDHSVKILAFVIMPNHIHVVWKPLKPNVQLRFMKFTAQQIKFFMQDNYPDKLNHLFVDKKDRNFQIWQRNSLAVELYTPTVIEQKIDYIHNNPCQGKWILANDPIAYKFSSASFYELDDDSYKFLSHYKDFV